MFDLVGIVYGDDSQFVEGDVTLSMTLALGRSMFNRPFSKMAAENSNKSKLKTYTSTRKSTFSLVTLQSFSISGVISADKM